MPPMTLFHVNFFMAVTNASQESYLSCRDIKQAKEAIREAAVACLPRLIKGGAAYLPAHKHWSGEDGAARVRELCGDTMVAVMVRRIRAHSCHMLSNKKSIRGTRTSALAGIAKRLLSWRRAAARPTSCPHRRRDGARRS